MRWLRAYGQEKLSAVRRGSGKSCEFVLHVDMSDTDKGCTMKWETALGPKLLQKSVQDALLGPLLEHIYKPKVNGPFNVHVNATLEDGAPLDAMASAQSYEREDGMPVEIFIVIVDQGAEAAGAARAEGGGRVTSACAAGVTFNLTIETASGFSHKGLPSPDSIMTTTLTAKWLRKPLKEALVLPFLDGLNGARPKGSSKLGLDNVRGIFGWDNAPIRLDAPAASLASDDGEPVALRVEIGEIGRDQQQQQCNGGEGSPALEREGSGASLERAASASAASASASAADGAYPRMRWLRAYGEEKLSKGPSGTFHLYAGEVSIKAVLPKGALGKPLEDVLLAPFLDRLQGKGKGFSLIDSAKLQSARVEVDGQSADLSRPAGTFVRSPTEPVVIIYRMDGDVDGDVAVADQVATDGLPSYTDENLGLGLGDIALDGPLFTESEPQPPFSPTTSEGSSSAVFSTTNNNRALARARAARLTRSNSISTSTPSPSSGRRESSGGTQNGLIDFSDAGENPEGGEVP